MTNRLSPSELLQLVERDERLIAEAKEVADSRKDLAAEVKSKGYDLPTFRKVVKLRAMDANELAEQEAVLEMYREAVEV